MYYLAMQKSKVVTVARAASSLEMLRLPWLSARGLAV